jgi:hypothetical protein
MKFIRRLKKNRAIKSYVKTLPGLLAKDYGRSAHYRPLQMTTSCVACWPYWMRRTLNAIRERLLHGIQLEGWDIRFWPLQDDDCVRSCDGFWPIGNRRRSGEAVDWSSKIRDIGLCSPTRSAQLSAGINYSPVQNEGFVRRRTT